jgi:flagellar biosynthesis protein FlhG
MVDALQSGQSGSGGGVAYARPAPNPIIEPKVQPRPAAPAPAARAPAPVRHCPVIAITSGKGGVGKTSTCVNLAIALSQSRFRVAVLDADLGLANADVMCGLLPTTRLDAVLDLKADNSATPRRRLAQLAIDAPGGFRLVPGSVGIRKMANLPPAHRQAIFTGLSELEAECDLVLVDTGAGLSDGVTSFAAAADLTLVVATPEPTSIADAYAMIKTIAQIRAVISPKSGFRTAIIVNQARSPEEGRAVHERIAATSKKFLGIQPPLLGIIAHDTVVPASVRARKPFLLSNPTSKCSKDIRTLSVSLTKLINLKAPEQPEEKRRGLFGWLRKP